METENHKYIKYNDFWQNSLQRLEGITKDIEKDFYNLEKRYYDFNEIYSGIATDIDILASIYSSHNNLQGREYVLKLKALLNKYKKRYTHEGIDFRTIYFLNSKINKLRDLSFNEFPEMKHSFLLHKDFLNDIGRTDTDKIYERYNRLKTSAKFKWITFLRNDSRFIAPFAKMQIAGAGEIESTEKNNLKIKINFENQIIKELPLIDLFSKYAKSKAKPGSYNIITKYDEELKCFAADNVGRIILADTDFIRPLLKAFSKSTLSPGRLRLFGKNHIYLQ